MLKDVFGFAEHQEKATYGLGYKSILTRNKDEAALDKAAGFADARIKTDHVLWYVPHYKPAIQQQSILSYLNKFWAKYPQSSDMLKDLFLWNK